MSKRFAVSVVVVGLLIAALALPWLEHLQTRASADASRVDSSVAASTVEGVVRGLGAAPVEGAVVRWQTTETSTISATDGSFRLHGLPDGVLVTITAWHEGYLVGFTRVTPPQAGVVISMQHHYTEDNPDYQWYASNDPAHSMSCMHCMVAYPQWQANAHANSVSNPRFLSIYNGTDVTGMAEVGPGYKLDYAGTPGNCANCHAPAAVAIGRATPITQTTTVTGSISADMNLVMGVEAEGSFCEFCHKIGEVYLEPSTGLPYADRPGVLSMRLYRSPPGQVLWFGPFDDVARRVAYLDLEKQSQFCAPCHQFSFGGTPIYESFREWLESPYPAQGIRCQTCHMAPTGVDYFAFPDQGGLTRSPDLIASHLQPGAADVELLQDTVELSVAAEQSDDAVLVTVTITNTKAGHHVPTDHPGRHLVLVVRASDEIGQPLSLESGPVVPEWGGDQAGLPGQAFAKVLRDDLSGESPVVTYWRPTTIISDNRIAALATDTSMYSFALPANGETATVRVELRFRRLFQDLMTAKDWGTPDIIMEQAQVVLSTQPARTDIMLPLIQNSG